MNPKFDVVFFLHALNAGGAETHAIRLANHLDPAAFRVRLTVARDGGALTDRVADHVEVVPLGAASARSSTLSVLRAYLPLKRHLAESGADCLVSFMELPGIVGTAAARSAGVPAIVSLQNTLSRVLATRGEGPWVYRRALAAAAGRILPNADRIVALSRGVADDAVSVFPALAGRVEVIHNAGYDDRLLELAADEPPVRSDGEATRFLACGRLAPQKGYPDLIEAFASLGDDGPAELHIVGSGSLRASLERLARRLGVAERVTFLGFQSNPYRHMASADVFVLSSRYEGFANVIVEAMVCGLPVIATDCPHGPGEILTDGQNGLLVPPGRPDLLAGAMRRLAGDRTLGRRLADGGRIRARDFHADRIAEAYAETIRNVSARR